MTTTETILEIEQLLNMFSNKRYHVSECGEGTCALVEIIKMGKESIIVSGLTQEQMLDYLKKHLQVSLKEPVQPNVNVYELTNGVIFGMSQHFKKTTSIKDPHTKVQIAVKLLDQNLFEKIQKEISLGSQYVKISLETRMPKNES